MSTNNAPNLAIDFRRLLRAERRRAREAARKEKRRGKLGGGSNGGEGGEGGGGGGTESGPGAAPPRDPTPPGGGARDREEDGPLPPPLSPPRVPRITPADLVAPPGSEAPLRSVYYAPAFLPDMFADRVLRWLASLPEHRPGGGGGGAAAAGREREREADHLGKWTRLPHARRRVALFDAASGPSGRLPPPLRLVAESLVSAGAFPPDMEPNHVLVNEYRPGEGILPHTDGPAYESLTATISVGGGDAVVKFTRRLAGADAALTRGDEPAPALEVLLSGNGSLLLFTDGAYIDHLHSIDEVMEEVTSDRCGNAPAGVRVRRGFRVSLTFRRKKSADL